MKGWNEDFGNHWVSTFPEIYFNEIQKQKEKFKDRR